METVWLVVGALGMTGGATYFAYLGTRALQGTWYFYAITFTIALVAAIAYFVMATGGGSTILTNGREFYYARYVDRLITTPLILIDLALLALVAPGRNIGLIAGLVMLDVFMTLTGLWAGSTVGPGRYALFIVSTLAFIALLYMIITRLFAAARSQSRATRQAFNTLAVLTVVLWTLYPIVWLVGTEGFGSVGQSTEIFLFLVLDLLSKIGFGFLLLTNYQALSEKARGGGRIRASRVR
jgi:bacteriorhodopsin